jgi:hypothetical protein
VDTGVRYQVGLELVEVDVQGAIEAQRRGDGRHDLGDQTVEVLVARPGNVQIPAADIVDGLVVNQEGAVRVLNGAVGGEDGVVGLNDGRGEARRGVNSELQLALLAVVGRETLEEEGTETGASTTAKGVEDQEALERLAVVYDIASDMGASQASNRGRRLTSDTADAVDDIVDHLLADGVVATGIVVGRILLPTDQKLRVEELAVVAGADLVDGRRVKIDEDGAGDVFAVARLGEEGLERTALGEILSIGIRAAVRPQAVLEEVPGTLHQSKGRGVEGR